MEETTKELIRSLLEHFSFYDGWPRLTIYNDEGFISGEVDEELNEVLTQLNDLIGD